jgi:hypothetical protein
VFGHKWERAQGIVAQTLTDKVMVTGHRGPEHVHQYVVDVRAAGGREFRVTIPAPPGPSVELAPGTPVHLEVHAKDGEVRFDPQHPPSPVVGSGVPARDFALRELAQRAQDMRAQFAGGAGQAGLEQLMERLQGLGAGTPGGMVIGGGPQAAELVQELLAGGDHQAARERMRELRAQIIAQSGGRAGPAAAAGPGQAGWSAEPRPFASGPQPFASGAPQPFGEPQPFGAPQPSASGEPQPFGGPQPFDSGTPSTFDPVTPAQPAAGGGTFGEPADVFGREGLRGGVRQSSGVPSQADRIRALEALHSGGLLTEEQFAERRQQIMDET